MADNPWQQMASAFSPQMGAFNPLDSNHWANLFAQAFSQYGPQGGVPGLHGQALRGLPPANFDFYTPGGGTGMAGAFRNTVAPNAWAEALAAAAAPTPPGHRPIGEDTGTYTPTWGPSWLPQQVVPQWWRPQG